MEGKVKGKEYDNFGRLLFEGEYSDYKKWAGKFKEYHKEVLVFEGEYLNGKNWNGKGKLYNYNGI